MTAHEPRQPPEKNRVLCTRGNLHILWRTGQLARPPQGYGAREEPVAELMFRDGIMDRIRLRETRFDERAYLFVLAALEFSQTRLPERRHITGRELAIACRDLALQRFGVLSRLVLEHWGIRNSGDIGDIVFTLVELEFLLSQPTDNRDEFATAFDFAQAFERGYPWCGAIHA